MLPMIEHNDTGSVVAAAKLLTGYITVSGKLDSPAKWLSANQAYSAEFVSYVIAWQTKHKLTPDGVIGPKTWRTIAKEAPICSTSKQAVSGYTLALQLLLNMED